MVERRGGNGRWLQLERVKCGKPGCKKDAEGGHGPYFYLYFTNPNTGRYTSKYVGKPERITAELAAEFGIKAPQDVPGSAA